MVQEARITWAKAVELIAEEFTQRINDDPTLNEYRHMFALEKVGMPEDYEFTDQSEEEPWYPHYWQYVQIFDHAVLMQIVRTLTVHPDLDKKEKSNDA